MDDTGRLYEIVMYGHLATVIPWVFLGAYLFAAKKDAKVHRLLGKT